MTILDFVRTTRANLLLLIAGIVIGAIAGLGYSLLQPKVYAASASGYVTVGQSGTIDVLSGSNAAKERARSYSAIVSSEAVAKIIQEQNSDLSIGTIRGSLSATTEENSSLIKVRATASSPEQARVLANSALHATAQYIENIEKNGSGNNSTATPTPAGEENQESAQNKVSSTNPSDTTNTLIRVIPLDNASVNPPLVSPNYMQNGLIGAGAGLVLVYLAIFLRRSVDQRIRTRDDAIKATNSNILGVLPVSDDLAEENIVHASNDDHIAHESIRQLRTNLRFVNIDNPPSSFIVTSAVPGEGKSTVSLAVARSMASSGQPVILIDADLRRPTVAKKLHINAKIGLTQVLAGQVDIAPGRGFQALCASRRAYSSEPFRIVGFRQDAPAYRRALQGIPGDRGCSPAAAGDRRIAALPRRGRCDYGRYRGQEPPRADDRGCCSAGACEFTPLRRGTQ